MAATIAIGTVTINASAEEPVTDASVPETQTYSEQYDAAANNSFGESSFIAISSDSPANTSTDEIISDGFASEITVSSSSSDVSSEENATLDPGSDRVPFESASNNDVTETPSPESTADDSITDSSSQESPADDSITDTSSQENAGYDSFTDEYTSGRGAEMAAPAINSISKEAVDSGDTILKLWNPSVNEMRAGVWSSAGGQDDLKWYEMSKNADGWWECRILFANFKHGGKAFAHCYSGKIFTNGIEFECPASHEISKYGEGASDRVITITDPLSLLKAPKIAVWSLEGGQDDIKWYSMTKNGTSWSYTVPSRNLAHGGTVAVHCYDGSSYIIGTDYKVPAKYSISVTEVSGKYETITVTDNTEYLSSLRAAVWSAAGGQDDIKWYNMSNNSKGEWTCDALRSNLAHGGQIIVHCYSGNIFIAGITYQTPPTDIISASGSGSESRKIVISNSSPLYPSMRAAVWSTINGQDDLIWYEMKKIGNDWSADLLLSNLESAGQVAIHCYSGNHFVNGTGLTISEEDLKTNLDSQPKATNIYTGSGYKRYVVTSNYNYANNYNVLASYATIAEAQEVIMKQPASTMDEWYIFDTVENKVVVNYESPLAKTVAWVASIANDASHGYSCIGEQTKDNYKIEYARWGKFGDYSCSTLLAMAYELSGIENMRNIAQAYNVQCNYGTGLNYSSLDRILTISDKFKKISLGNYQAGDILISDYHRHVAMSLGNGKIVEAMMNELGQEFAVPTPGDQTREEIRIISDYGGWTSAFRSTIN